MKFLKDEQDMEQISYDQDMICTSLFFFICL